MTGSTRNVPTSRAWKVLAATLLTGSMIVSGCGTRTGSGNGSAVQSTHAGTTVEFTFAGSSDLVTQLTQGAQADVLATADSANMDKAWPPVCRAGSTCPRPSGQYSSCCRCWRWW
ncbi:molybdate ABC transporter, periplasmic molybdate-binding protein [Mycobacteroides abscessus subsp. abscessus]|nr:molybdate ABC transporter, periplasmic molybdate-binding protein [Mycobacteroides abscessus subsp. abscessus]